MMRCPLCLDSPLEPKFVRGIEVDICARCRGIWLDRGEIDRLGDSAPAMPPPSARPPVDFSRDDDRRARDDDRDRDRPKKNKKKSKAKMLADLLDDILD